LSKKENIEIATLHQLKEKPDKCPQCGNTKLRSDIVRANLGGRNVDHSYCQFCKFLMIIKPPPKNLFSEIKKSTAFVFKIDDKERMIPYGTGFFIRVKVESNPNRSFGYFVTAKHVLQDEKGQLFDEIVIRLNRRDGLSHALIVKLEPEKIFMHEDPNVDLALFPLIPDKSLFHIKYIQEELITNKEKVDELAIGEGDDVFFTGLFTSYLGQKQNQPICRFGKVALMPEEKIEWKEAGKDPVLRDLYLLECQSFGGNSGSPVFFQLSNENVSSNVEKNPSLIYLAGIMMGSFLTGSEIQDQTTIHKPLFFENVGISAVTPAYKLHELLFSDKLKEQRKNSQKNQ